MTKDLAVREWDCPVCGSHHDRDHNDAINLKTEALRIALL
ncbi:MAG: transposase [Erysipelotrichaceae bacterium]|nr:transposase [Erysipelotrichaceae bacterium]